MIGYVDRCDATAIAGWLIDLAAPSKYLKVKILVDEICVHELMADEYREDLASNEAFNGTTHAFSFSLPSELADGKTHLVKIIESDCGYVLNNSPSSISFSTTHADSARTQRLDLALVGKNGWLFLCNDSNDAIGQYTGDIRFNHDQLDKYVNQYSTFQQLCNEKGIYYLLTIAPGKEYIYPEYLPDSVRALNDLTISDEFIENVTPVLNNKIVNFKNTLLGSKHLGPLCYKSDSHWNYLGAKLAAEEIICSLRSQFPQLPTFEEMGFKLILNEESFGDLSNKNRLDYSNGHYVDATCTNRDTTKQVCAIGVDYEKTAIELTEHSYVNLSKTRPTRLFKKSNHTNLPRAIILRDSYADWLLPFLSECFFESLFIWGRSVPPSVIETFKPDLIIEEVVDRFLIRSHLSHQTKVAETPVQIINQNSQTTMTPVLYGMSSYIPDAPFLNAEDLSRQTGANTGNLLFCHATSRMLHANPIAIPWGGDLNTLSPNRNRLVVPLANFLGKHIDLGELAETFRSIDVPIVGVGLGTQGPISGVSIDTIPDGSWEWVRVLSSKSATNRPNISLRGQLTYDAIAAKGLEGKCVVTGCPSNFINPSATLGREIYRRRANGIKRVMAICGSPYLPELKTLEQSLVGLVESTDGLYVIQHPIVAMQLFKQEYSNIAERDFCLYKDYIHPSLTNDEFMQWFRRWSYAFTSVPEWLSFIKGFDLVVGTRIHGVMAGIQSGVPSLCLCIDSRTLELCQTMGIPYVNASEYVQGICLGQIEDILKRWNWRAYDDTRFALAECFVDFFKGNQLEVFGAPKELLVNKKKSLLKHSSKNREISQTHQLSTASEDGRYPAIFSALAKSIPQSSNIKILSYGCSDGFETTDLALKYFPHAQIVGTDIDNTALRIAKSNNRFPSRVLYIKSDRTELLKLGPFDLIVCMAVLCSWPQTRNVENCCDIYPFEKFEDSIGFLSSLLSKGGVLCVYNANFLVTDTKHLSNFVVHSANNLLPHSQQVRLFRPNGEPYGLYDPTCDTHEAQKMPGGFSIIFKKN